MMAWDTQLKRPKMKSVYIVVCKRVFFSLSLSFVLVHQVVIISFFSPTFAFLFLFFFFFVYSYCKHNEVFPSFDQCLLFLLATRTILRRQTLNEIFRGYGHISGVIGYEKRTRRRHIGSIHVSLHFFPFE